MYKLRRRKAAKFLGRQCQKEAEKEEEEKEGEVVVVPKEETG